MSSSADKARYIPALRFRSLTRFYDRILGAALKEEAFKEHLVRQARIGPGHRVLDLGHARPSRGRGLTKNRAVPDVSLGGLT